MGLAPVLRTAAFCLLASARVVTGQVVPEQVPPQQLIPERAGRGWGRVVAYQLEGGLTSPSPLDAQQIARRYLDARVGRVGVEYTLDARSSSFDGAVEHFTFTPRVAGIPYFDASAQVHVDRGGRVVRFDAAGPLPPPRDLVFASDARRAAKAALRRWANLRSAPLREGAAKSDGERRTALHSGDLAAPLIASRAWFGVSGEARPAWVVYVEPDGQPASQVVVDADTGDTLYQRTLVQHAEPDGYVFPAPETQNPDKGAYALRFLSGRRDARGACPAPIYPSWTAIGGLCWTDGAATLGNNVDACADLDGNDVCDGRALAVAGRFLYPFRNAYETTASAAADLSAALVNAFYWTNIAHDWLYDLGFDEASGNFQHDNFGRGGYAGDRLRVDVQDGAVSNNAWFSTPPDGMAPRMQLGLWPSARRDGAFDGDVILHEYVHGLTSRLIGGPLDAGALFLWQSGGMGEGWSDVLSASFTNDPVIGEYGSRNPVSGIRTVRYDQSPLTFGQFGVRRPAVLPGTTKLAGLPAVHRDGEIWASVLWDVREAMGRESFERIVVAALKLTPRRPSMLAARDAILQAATLSGYTSAQLCRVWDAFAARGFGASAALNPVGPGEWPDTALSVYESFDSPAFCGGSPPASGLVLLEEGAETASAWTADGLWHRTARRASSGGQSWWFGREQTGNYDLGTRASGSLTSPEVDLTGVTGATLEWRQFFRGEGFLRPLDMGGGLDPYLNLDSGRLWISLDGGANWNVLSHIVHNTPGTAFAEFRVNLSRFVGHRVRLRFEFDTFTAFGNAAEGWYLDDIRVRAAGAPPHLEVYPLALTFAATRGSGSLVEQTLAIENSGGGDLRWQAGALSAPWLSVSPGAGSGPTAMRVSANPSGLSPGRYTTALEVNAGEAGRIFVPVTLQVEDATPVAAWTFEEPGAGPGVTVIDQTGFGRDGVTSGLGTAPAEGVAGRGRLFNGLTDGVTVIGDAGLTPSKMTVRLWVKLQSFPLSFGVLAAQFGGANAQGWYLAVRSTGEVVVMGASPPASMPWLLSSARLELGRWHHVAATLDRTTGQARLYIDGATDRSATFPGIAADPAAPLTFGKASWTNSYYLNAVIDDAIILPMVLPPAAVRLDYDAFAPPPRRANTAVAARWSFDSNLADESGNGFHPIHGGGGSVSGVRGAARRLQGPNDALQILLGDSLNAASFTLRTWIKLPQAPGAWCDLLSNYGADFSGWRLGFAPDGKPFFAVAAKPDKQPYIEAPAPLELDRWTALAAVYDGPRRTMTLYVNGVPAAHRTAVDMTPRVEGLMTIGRASWTNAYAVHADVDETLIAPRAWSAGEVAADFASFPSPDSAGALLASWSFEETALGGGAVFADGSGGGRHIVASGVRHAPHSGLSGVARRFGGYPDVAIINRTDDFAVQRFTFSAWVRLDQYPTGWGAIFGNYDGGWAGWFAGVREDGRVLLSVAGPNSKPWLLSAQALALGRWHHIAVAFDGYTRHGRIYIDGVQSASAVFPAWAVSSGVPPALGRASWGQTGWLAFSIDEARFFASARSAADIHSEYAALAAAANPGPVAEWRFDEAQGAATLADSTGRGHFAQLDDPAATAVPGQSSGAWRFSGLGGASIAPHPELGAPSFSFDAWINLDALPSRWGVLYSSYSADSRGWYVAVDPAGKLILCVAGQPSSAPWLVSTRSVSPGVWTHVAVTFDAVNRKGSVYIQGALDRTAVFPAFSPQTSHPSTFARASWTPSYALPVAIDRARLWNHERSASQIAELFGAP